jgi:hypothetical protein
MLNLLILGSHFWDTEIAQYLRVTVLVSLPCGPNSWCAKRLYSKKSSLTLVLAHYGMHYCYVERYFHCHVHCLVLAMNIDPCFITRICYFSISVLGGMEWTWLIHSSFQTLCLNALAYALRKFCLFSFFMYNEASSFPTKSFTSITSSSKWWSSGVWCHVV